MFITIWRKFLNDGIELIDIKINDSTQLTKTKTKKNLFHFLLIFIYSNNLIIEFT